MVHSALYIWQEGELRRNGCSKFNRCMLKFKEHEIHGKEANYGQQFNIKALFYKKYAS